MNFNWLKRYVPRGLYGRAALILIFPVVFLQLVVSFVFIQRHFEGVTDQMTRAAAREVRLVLDHVATRDRDPETLDENRVVATIKEDKLIFEANEETKEGNIRRSPFMSDPVTAHRFLHAMYQGTGVESPWLQQLLKRFQ